MKRPFLSIVTRCHPKRTTLEKTRKSVEALSDPDWEHVLLHDNSETGRGLLWANQQFEANRDVPRGQYVFILDDDDFLTEPDFIQKLKEAASSEKAPPDVIVFKWNHRHLGIMPSADCWRKKIPGAGHIGSSCFAVRRDVWREYIKEFSRPAYGDFHFVMALHKSGAPFCWLDAVMGSIRGVGLGKGG